MNSVLSHSYAMELIDTISETLYKRYQSYKKVEQYLKRWQKIVNYESYGYNQYPVFNFELIYKNGNNDKIDTISTLNQLTDELIIQMAIDLEIEVTRSYLFNS